MQQVMYLFLKLIYQAIQIIIFSIILFSNNFIVNVLVDFYCERLSDTASVPELLQGIVSLTNFNKFHDENALKVAKSYVFLYLFINVYSFLTDDIFLNLLYNFCFV